ncbi:MAG: hypothetical protein VKL41_21880 [Snowella sp.]|nr:hypothetical protein [Snowella sp.]
MTIISPLIRSSFFEYRNRKKKERDAKIKRRNELAQIVKQNELDQFERQKAIAIREQNERLKYKKDKEVSGNNIKYIQIVLGKYKNARFRGEVQYTGAYRIPIAEYYNYDLNIQGLSFFIDNVKSTKGKGKIEVRHNSFDDTECDTYFLEIIDGFAVLNQDLKNKNRTPRKNYSSTYREVYLTIRENSFENINTGIVHNIKFTPYSVLDWK